MPLGSPEIIEEVIDELALGVLRQRADAVRTKRVIPTALLLAYGDLGRLHLEVSEQRD